NYFLQGRGLIETAIGQLKEICQIQNHGHHSPNNFLAGLLAYVFKPNISHGKIGSRAYSLRQTEVILAILFTCVKRGGWVYSRRFCNN
ncbi:MAG: hypothetical protein MRQ10_03875, partial [Candidatus Midichloria mitochondrii]|nr:hypothetical protein [Candidatus Midichloria mitochondrii]